MDRLMSMAFSRFVNACLLTAAVGCGGLVLADPIAAGATSCAGPGAPPRSLVAGVPAYDGAEGTLWSAYDLAITGTVVEIRTDEERDSAAYGATEIIVEVINAMGVDSISDQVTISARDPGWMDGYAFALGRTYFVPLKSPGPEGQQYWSFVCDPISEISASDASALLVEVAAGIPTAVPGVGAAPKPAAVGDPSETPRAVALNAESANSQGGLGSGWMIGIAAGAATALAMGGLLLRRLRSVPRPAQDASP
jgi:hypothetical protein